MLITSPHNPRISKLHDLYTTRGRKKSGLFLMEGPHLLEVLLNAGIAPREVYYQPGLLQRTASGRALLERLLHASGLSDNQLIEVSERKIVSIAIIPRFYARRRAHMLHCQLRPILHGRLSPRERHCTVGRCRESCWPRREVHTRITSRTWQSLLP